MNRTVTGAHYGLGSWLVQRMTAVVMALATFAIVFGMAKALPHGYAAWKSVLGSWWMTLALTFFSLAAMLHAWVGMRDILMDYIKPTGLRLALEVLVILALAYYSVWAMRIVWSF